MRLTAFRASVTIAGEPREVSYDGTTLNIALPATIDVFAFLRGLEGEPVLPAAVTSGRTKRGTTAPNPAPTAMAAAEDWKPAVPLEPAPAVVEATQPTPPEPTPTPVEAAPVAPAVVPASTWGQVPPAASPAPLPPPPASPQPPPVAPDFPPIPFGDISAEPPPAAALAADAVDIAPLVAAYKLDMAVLSVKTRAGDAFGYLLRRGVPKEKFVDVCTALVGSVAAFRKIERIGERASTWYDMNAGEE